jgi:hypothetical protein
MRSRAILAFPRQPTPPAYSPSAIASHTPENHQAGRRESIGVVAYVPAGQEPSSKNTPRPKSTRPKNPVGAVGSGFSREHRTRHIHGIGAHPRDQVVQNIVSVPSNRTTLTEEYLDPLCAHVLNAPCLRYEANSALSRSLTGSDRAMARYPGQSIINDSTLRANRWSAQSVDFRALLDGLFKH